MKATILVIEDSEAINNLICLNLEAADYKPLSFTDGGEAGAFLDKISGKGQAAPADLALVDIMLPGRDGFSLLPQLRALYLEMQNSPFLFCNFLQKRLAKNTGFVLIITVVLCMKNSFAGDMWSETAAILGYSSLGDELNVPSTVKVMESITPYGCMLRVAALILGYSLTLGFLILPVNLWFGPRYGMPAALLYRLYGFLLDPDVPGTLPGMEDYELYKIRSLVGWISPLNHAVFGMHDFGYDNLPSVGSRCCSSADCRCSA